MATLEDRLKIAEEKLRQLKEAKKRAEARVKNTEAKKRRSLDNRKKTLVGAMILDLMSREGEEAEKWQTTIMKRLDGWLKRPSERELFGFAPLEEGEAANEPPTRLATRPTFAGNGTGSSAGSGDRAPGAADGA